MPADVFLSYARNDINRARLIKERLEELGLTVFFDVEGLDSGDVFPDVLDREVKSAGAVVGVWSAHSLTRPWVKIECDIGRARGVLVPVQIEEISPLDRPAAFWNIQFDDLSDFDGNVQHAGWLKFIRALSRTLKRPELLERESARQASSSMHVDTDVREELQALRALVGDMANAKIAAAESAGRNDLAAKMQLWSELKSNPHLSAMRRFLEDVRGTPLFHIVEMEISRIESMNQLSQGVPSVDRVASPASAVLSKPPNHAVRFVAAVLIGFLGYLVIETLERASWTVILLPYWVQTWIAFPAVCGLVSYAACLIVMRYSGRNRRMIDWLAGTICLLHFAGKLAVMVSYFSSLSVERMEDFLVFVALPMFAACVGTVLGAALALRSFRER